MTREAAVGAMVRRQHHRGPDDHAVHTIGDATLGMARLAIFDPENGRQPMRSPDGRYTLVFNGALYNYRELQAELRAGGWAFRTQCDTEVLLAAFARHGEACLSRLRGMFAFAVWDAWENRLFAARDALGIKPLYYARRASGGVLLASEISALLASGQLRAEIDPTSAAEYLAWFAVPAPRTIYRGIASLPPGHLLRVGPDNRVQVAAWWHLPEPRQTERRARHYADFVHTLRARLDDSIRAHRLADVPVGAFLSGGLDSSAVVGLMARAGGAPLKTFSLIFEDARYSERDAARIAAQAYGTEHHEDVLTGARVAADLPHLLAAFDQPTGDGINTYYASRLARAAGVKVALSGLGGDELFGSYPSFQQLPRLNRLLPWWRRLPAGVRASGIERLRQSKGTRARKLADFLGSARDLHELAALQRRVFPESTRLSLLHPDVRSHAARLGPLHPRLDDFVGELLGADDSQIISAWEMRTYMTDVLLRDSDVFSMRHSLELRVPFIDLPLLDWLWPQPDYFKHPPGGTKRALADAVADVVPAAIRLRPKQGFTLPFAQWMRAELKPFLHETFSSDSLAACPWLDPVVVQSLWADYLAGRDPRAWSRVWSLAVLIAFANRSQTDRNRP